MRKPLAKMERWTILALCVCVAVGFAWLAKVQNDQNRSVSRQNEAIRKQNVLLQKQVAQGAQAHAVLCVLRVDFRGRVRDTARDVRATEEFLRAHPFGIPGISAKLLHQSLNNRKETLASQMATLESLSGLRCPKPNLLRRSP